MALALSGVMAAPVAAQDGAPEVMSAVPESPAFVFAGLSPATIISPATVRDFGVALANAIDSQGRVVQGFALEATPWLLASLEMPLDEYQQSWWRRTLSNAQLSVSTGRASGDSASTAVGFGLRLQLVDRADPMQDPTFTRELGDSLQATLATCVQDPTISEEEALACQLERGSIDALFRRETAARWNAFQLGVAVASGVRLAASDLRQAEYAGLQGWLVGAMPLGPVGGPGKLVGQFGYTHQPGFGVAPSADVFTYGGRLVFGSATFNGYVEAYAETRTGVDDDTDGTFGAWSGGVEFRITENFWLATGFGNRYDALRGDDRTFVIADLRWAGTEKARLTPERIRN